MAAAPNPGPAVGTVHDRGYHAVRIARVIEETADAKSFVFELSPEQGATFRYDAGQFLTFRVPIDGQTHYRSYSMSSAPAVDDELQVTVKRVPHGVVSNWMNDHLAAGDHVDVSLPAGVFQAGIFQPGATRRSLVAFAGGSGITPVLSILKTALKTTDRSVHLLYANRDRAATIFADALDALVAQHPGRLSVEHHLDSERGFVDRAALGPMTEHAQSADTFICGPGPFMELVEGALLDRGVAQDQIHIERFLLDDGLAAAAASPPSSGGATTTITIEINGEIETAEHIDGLSVLQMARQMGLKPPSSCEAGSCATCIAKITQGSVTMRVNDALFEDEVEEGWILSCQSLPTSPVLHVVYGADGR